MADYEYDVFISYCRAAPVLDWMQNHFKALVENWLDQNMPRKPKVFIDWQMAKGSNLPSTIRNALEASRCMLSVQSPPYWRSAWCMEEWKTMRAREQHCGLFSSKAPEGLIYVVRFADGKHFPQEEVANRNYDDLNAYAHPGKAFSDSPKYLELEKKVRDEIVPGLVEMINRAPPWPPGGWPPANPTGNLIAPEPVRANVPRL